MIDSKKTQWNKRELSYINTHGRLKEYYKNAKNSIEDPLFTGFTLAIDNLHSPLFYSCCGINESDTLRSSENNTELAEKMEEAIKNMYKVHIYGNTDSYEITTLSAKDDIGGRKAGYGLQDKFYLDNPIYGAVDYIYMVDKVSESKYTDFLGVSDLGNGGPLKSNYADVEKLIPQVLEIQDELVQAKYDEVGGDYYDEEKQEWVDPAADITSDSAFDVLIEKKYDDLVQNDTHHQELIDAAEGAVNPETGERTGGAKGKLNEEEEKLTKAQNELKSLESNLKSQKEDIEDELLDFKDEAWSYLDRLKKFIEMLAMEEDENDEELEELMNNPYDMEYAERFNLHQYSIYTEIEGKVNTMMNKFNSFITLDTEEYKKKYEHLNVSFGESEFTDEEKAAAKNDGVFDSIYTVLNTFVSKCDTSDEMEKMISEKKKEIEEQTKATYGVHPDGRLGSKDCPGDLPSGEPSPCKEYASAQEEVSKDRYSKNSYELAALKDAKADYDYMVRYNMNQDTKKQVTKNIPDIDITKKGADLIAEKNTRQTFEVPQTVYDMLGFTEGMRRLTTEYPYVLQSVSGLDEAYKNYFQLKDPYMGSGEGKITIQCLEFLDMRVSSMFNKYMNAVYDRQFRRERVPVNLRRFECSIFVHDIRNFKNALGKNPSEDLGGLAAIVELALNYVSVVEFKFYDCEIVPDETGGIFDSVSNISAGEMKNTNFTFTYGNCVINFLPFEDLKKYVFKKERTEGDTDITPATVREEYGKFDTKLDGDKYVDEDGSLKDMTNLQGNGKTTFNDLKNSVTGTDSNFRRWFDRSELGNVGNNDYRDYIRHDSSVAVDDHYKTTIVNNFALNSVVNKNKELTAMDDALRRTIIGISASTGIPAKGVADALNLRNIYPYLTEQDLGNAAVVKNIGNVTNSKVVNPDTMEYIGTVITDEEHKPEVTTDLGNVNKEKGGN